MKESFTEKPQSTAPSENTKASESFPNYTIGAAAAGVAMALTAIPDGVEAKDLRKQGEMSRIEASESITAKAERLVNKVATREDVFGDSAEQIKIRGMVDLWLSAYLAQYPDSREVAIKTLADEVQKAGRKYPPSVQTYAFKVLQASVVPGTKEQMQVPPKPVFPPSPGDEGKSERRVNRTQW